MSACVTKDNSDVANEMLYLAQMRDTHVGCDCDIWLREDYVHLVLGTWRVRTCFAFTVTAVLSHENLA